MASIMYTLFSITAGASLHCSVRPLISPCTCSPHDILPNTIHVTCERMDSFSQVFDLLKDRFAPNSNIYLKLTHSQLDDLDVRTFADMNMNIKNLKLNNDNLSSLPSSTFRNMGKNEHLSLAENLFEEIPRGIFSHMPKIQTLDFAHGRIKFITKDDFKDLSNLRTLVLGTNQIRYIERGSFPSTLISLHIGKNNLTSLNGVLHNLHDLKLLFINANNLTTLDDEIPPTMTNLNLILAQYNSITHLPQSFKFLPNLDAIFLNNNELKSLDGLLQHASTLDTLDVSYNNIEYLAVDEFLNAKNLRALQMGNNLITSLNGSLLNIKDLRIANFSFNLLKEFSLLDVSGLRRLKILDLSHNRIELLTGQTKNFIEAGPLIRELRLSHNLLKTLNGALMGMNNLRVLSLTSNLLEIVSPEDLIGMDELETLDLSNNRLKTLKELSTTFLPSLKSLNASNNLLSVMEKDFHGLPILCVADLSNNMITTISIDLVEKTHCSNFGVRNTLEIYLRENPVLCHSSLPELVSKLMEKDTKLIGFAHCLVQEEEDKLDTMMKHPPPIPILLQPAQIPLGSNPINPILLKPASILQIFVPAGNIPIIQQLPPIVAEIQLNITNPANDEIEIEISKELEAGETSAPNTSILTDLTTRVVTHQYIDAIPSSTIAPVKATISASTNDLDTEPTMNSILPTTIQSTTSTPFTTSTQSVSSSTPDLNVNIIQENHEIHDIPEVLEIHEIQDAHEIHETIPEVLLPPIDKAQALSTEPEEPPELLQDQNVSLNI